MVQIASFSLSKAVRGTAIILAILLLVLGTIPGSRLIPNTVAAIGTCQVSDLNPHSADTGQDTGFLFTVTSNTDAIAWIQVTTPNANMVIDGASSDWLPTATFDAGQATFSGSPINPGNPLTVQVDGTGSNFPPASWSVSASANSNGSNAGTCTGDTSITMNDSAPPVITSISTTTTSNSATVTWHTSKDTDATLDYGPTSSYGTTLSNSTFAAVHSFQITGLTPLTAYHYQVSSADSLSQSVSSSDGTFTTSAAPPPGGGGGGGSGGSGSSGTPVGTHVTNPADKTPPTISLTSSIPKVVKIAPTVTGTAGDNVAVNRVEYSTDGGQNWLSVDTATGLGGKKVTFSFTPLNLNDGTYQLVARAVDAGGNTASTAPVQLVIDRLPPAVGGSVISLGPQILEPDNHGVIHTMTGVALKINLSTIGGTTSVTIDAMNTGSKNHTLDANFALRQGSSTELWSGELSFSDPGAFQLVAHATDGAGNVTDRDITTVLATNPGLALSSKGPVKQAQITVYYMDPDSSDWIIWDGQAYGQSNPQTSDTHGSFNLLLPAGTYYLYATAAGFLPFTSDSFTLTDPSPVTSVLNMTPASGLSSVLSPWYDLFTAPLTDRTVSVVAATSDSSQNLVGQALSGIDLVDTDGFHQGPVGWLGKPTVVSILSTWDPATAEQLAALSDVAQNTDINVRPLGMQENASRLRAYNAISGSHLPWLADPGSTTTDTLSSGLLPTHYFIDRKGVVRQITTGVLSSKQLLDILTNLN